MPARSVCLVTLSLSEAGPGRFGGQVSVIDIYHTIPYMANGVGADRSICLVTGEQECAWRFARQGRCRQGEATSTDDASSPDGLH